MVRRCAQHRCLFLSVVLLLGATMTTQSTAPPPQTPNIVVMLGDDIGWADVSYNGGIAKTPRLDAWSSQPGSIRLMDMHSGGTVCSPTRATILTGRNHFRDCVNYVYGCSDMTGCVPDGTCDGGAGTCRFAPQNTYTVADLAKDAGYSHIFFAGKWHLGSFYNDSEKYGGYTSSPVTHGFFQFNATVEVAPTADANCQCNEAEWGPCDLGHYNASNHCSSTCCFNYWWRDDAQEHAVKNLTHRSPVDDSTYVVDALRTYVIRGAEQQVPLFLAQLSFHNCHIPFIATDEARRLCETGETCAPVAQNASNYSSAELDYYGCLTELDSSVGAVLDWLSNDLQVYDNTLIWFATDNGPEVNCPPLGFCDGPSDRPAQAPGSAGILRGRKRDLWEGGHRVPGVISWPSRLGKTVKNRVSWDLLSTVDLMPTLLDLFQTQRPASQLDWPLDGVSILPLLVDPDDDDDDDDETDLLPPRGLGWWYFDAVPTVANGWAFRFGNWSFVQGSTSCNATNCTQPQLYDLTTDLAQRRDLATVYPDILAALIANFSAFNASVQRSRALESMCDSVSL